MKEYNDYIHNNLIDQLKETYTKAFNLFTVAYKNLNEDVKKAKKEFIEIINNCNFVVKSLPFYDDNFKNFNRNEDLFYIVQMLSLLVKASHNLWVIARHNNDEEEKKKYNKMKHHYKGLLYYYYHLSYLLKVERRVLDIMDVIYKEVNNELLDEALGEMTLLDFSLRNNMLERYLNYEFSSSYKHYFKAYQEFKLLDDVEYDDIAHHLAVLLKDKIKDKRIKKIIYDSIFFECLMLEYAYQNNQIYLVDDILFGYDYYLEIDSLYIFYQYDHERYQKYFEELKYIALERFISLCDPNGRNYLLARDIFPHPFINETLELATKNIAKINRNDKNDYRNHDDRKKIDF